MQETIIKLEHVSKEYRLGAIGGGTLVGDLQSWMARMQGKEDPNSKIGSVQHTGNVRFKALDDISFEIKKGEAVGIIGHNGAGKSTLLKLLSRVTAPSDGTISYNGRIVSMLEVGTGFHPELTGRENVYMNGAILGMTKAEISAKFDDIVKFAEMEKFIDTPVKRYSSGMYVKLAFSVAAHLDSEIMIMDEVLAVGDMAFQKKCLDKMRDAAHVQGRTVLYVSHNMNTIRQLCERVIVMDHGRIVFDGDVEEGIAIYSNVSDIELPVEYDLTNVRMSFMSKEVDAKITSIKILNKTIASYKSGEPLDFIATVKAYKNIDNLNIRFELRYSDDVPVGTAICRSSLPLKETCSVDLHLAFDTSLLTRGKYKVVLVIYETNSFGVSYDLDCVYPSLVFSIEDSEVMNWNKSAWGHILFSNLELIDSGETDI